MRLASRTDVMRGNGYASTLETVWLAERRPLYWRAADANNFEARGISHHKFGTRTGLQPLRGAIRTIGHRECLDASSCSASAIVGARSTSLSGPPHFAPVDVRGSF
jgi:hypothetical protein